MLGTVQSLNAGSFSGGSEDDVYGAYGKGRRLTAIKIIHCQDGRCCQLSSIPCNSAEVTDVILHDRQIEREIPTGEHGMATALEWIDSEMGGQVIR